MVSDYQKTAGLIDEIEKSLSLGSKARTETAIKKLISALKGNNEFRQQLIAKLDEITGKDLRPSLAGTALNPAVPSGLVGRGIFAGGLTGTLSGLLSPNLLFGLTLTSPRIVGELLRVLGLSDALIKNILDFIKSPAGRKALEIQYQAGRLEDDI